MKEIIVISSAGNLTGEPDIWNELFRAGLAKLHVRKPGFKANSVATLLSQVEEQFLSRIVIHYYSGLARKFNLGGIHFSCPDVPDTDSYRLEKNTSSCSVHSWQELRQVKDKADYCFISPVFDSISKQNYKRNETLWHLPDFARTYPVYALGGVNLQNMSQVLAAGFHGIALLGAIWQAREPVNAFRNFLNKLQELKS